MESDLRRLRGDRDKKSVPHCIVHACMNGLFFLTTELHQKYIKITSLLRHFYIIFTSDLTSELFVHPPLFLGLLHVLKMVFPAVPATPHGHAINCVPVHRFRVRRTSETGLTPAEWREFPRYALVRILMHAVKTEPARFWRVFGWFVACFTGFPSETRSGRLSGARNVVLW
ncbi:hypothetical protein [Escherichia coli]|uniref:hypothetical protein n=1 Tax=Escherichia coli TaxID=562 RepID=UPI0029DDDB6F|nr:hypothetical protein [Escherichia coli]MDX7320248.1 hypothetical protein [Escherichia coli]